MMPTIRIDDEVWAYLKSKGIPFEDTPNDVLRRELGIGRKADAAPAKMEIRFEEVAKPATTNLPPLDYRFFPIKGFELDGKHYKCDSFAKLLEGVCFFLHMKHGHEEFSRAAAQLRGKIRPYFSKDPKDLRVPHKIAASLWYVETNFPANAVVQLIHDLMLKLGHDPNQFRVE
jgi:negative regulator of replication initiation